MVEKLKDTVRREGHARLERERRQVDEVVVTANITFLGAFVVLLALTETPEAWVGYLSAFSLSSLVLSLLAFLWHRYRHPLRELRWKNGE